MRRAALLLLIALGCTRERPPRADVPSADAELDTSVRGEVRQQFVPPEHWEQIRLPSGLQFRQPEGFTVGLHDGMIGTCGDSTSPADKPILDKTFLEHWPLTLGMRRGDLSRIAAANGFTLDAPDITSTDDPADSTVIRRGEGWILLGTKTSLFAAVRHPAGCHLVWAARGQEINPDTLGLVLSTLRWQ